MKKVTEIPKNNDTTALDKNRSFHFLNAAITKHHEGWWVLVCFDANDSLETWMLLSSKVQNLRQRTNLYESFLPSRIRYRFPVILEYVQPNKTELCNKWYSITWTPSPTSCVHIRDASWVPYCFLIRLRDLPSKGIILPPRYLLDTKDPAASYVVLQSFSSLSIIYLVTPFKADISMETSFEPEETVVSAAIFLHE